MFLSFVIVLIALGGKRLCLSELIAVGNSLKVSRDP